MSLLHDVRNKVQMLLEDKNSSLASVFEKIEKKINVKREYIFYASVFSLALLVCYGHSIICNLVGFLYPAYESVKSIESKSKDDDTKWLMYWCVYVLVDILEIFSDILLFWIPFYTLSKCIFLVWLMIPGSTGGTHFIYNKVLRVFVLKHQNTIDNGINKAKSTIDKISSEAKNLVNSENIIIIKKDD